MSLQATFYDFIVLPKGCTHIFYWREGYGESSEWYIIGNIVQFEKLVQEETSTEKEMNYNFLGTLCNSKCTFSEIYIYIYIILNFFFSIPIKLIFSKENNY